MRIDLVTRRRRWVWHVTLQLRVKVAGRITFIRIGSNDGGPSGSKFGTVGYSWATTALVMKAFGLRCLVSAWQQLRHYGRQVIRNGQKM